MIRFLAAALISSGLFSTSAFAAEIAPFKDRLFAYPAVLATSDGGAHRTIDYDEMRDINGRDAVPERQVKPAYVDLAPRRQQQDLALRSPLGEIRHVAVGKQDGAAFIALYLHGQGGSRKQGVDDATFGGNFNRLKNLATRNDGLYLTPDFPDFGEGGANRVAALITHYATKSPGAKVVIACGSMGGALCWMLAQKPETVGRLAGLVLLGSHWDDAFLGSPAFDRRVPVFIGHGSRDRVFPVERQEQFFRSVLAKSASYPIRFVRFEGGTHGTPIRMSDWREILSWMLAPG